MDIHELTVILSLSVNQSIYVPTTVDNNIVYITFELAVSFSQVSGRKVKVSLRVLNRSQRSYYHLTSVLSQIHSCSTNEILSQLLYLNNIDLICN